MKKNTVLGFLVLAVLLTIALPLFAAPAAPAATTVPAAPSAVPGAVPSWLAGLTPTTGAGPGFLPQPLLLTACSQPDRQACTIGCRQDCQAGGCRYDGSTCTVEGGCVCAPCLCP